ncbi:hypothetical protein [Brevibacterium moorei]|uniref:hypothetical protein n=1 Tax=Brevibacterium moorei TaxID=2968457 RepID=UPI00211BA968|nr:hypothetical protein [Brevibacterium sp. 68QC2CO]MCQ9385754.1 hypothetical protein [Brevibacterium sp. 68QC2CO]
MYELIWRALPGNWFIKLLICLALVVAAVYVLMEYVFPLIAPFMPFNNATVGTEEGA